MLHFLCIFKTKIVREGSQIIMLCGNTVQSTKTLIGLSITECHKKTAFVVSNKAIFKLNKLVYSGN